MKKNLPVKKIIFITLAILAGVYLWGGARKAAKEIPKAENAPKKAKILDIPQVSEGIKQNIKLSGPDEEQTVLSFDMTGYTRDGKKKWEIRGQSADIISDVVILNNIEADAYSEGRKVKLSAEHGKYDKKENSIKLEDNVVITTSDEVTIKAEWFKWNSETNEIVTDSFVEVEKDELYASGYGAVASTKEKEVQLNKNVTVRQDEININCGGPLIIDYSNNNASFYDSVKVAEPKGEMLSDRLDILFDPDSRKIKTAIAEGNVELKQGENIAKGQKIIYTMATGEAVLTGNPEILIYSKKEFGDALTGE